MHAAQHFLMQDSSLSALDSVLIGLAGLALALSASFENTSRNPRFQVEKYGMDRHGKRDRRLDAGLFGVLEDAELPKPSPTRDSIFTWKRVATSGIGRFVPETNPPATRA